MFHIGIALAFVSGSRRAGSLDRARAETRTSQGVWIFSSLTNEELELQVAPTRNRLIDIWGHLTASNDPHWTANFAVLNRQRFVLQSYLVARWFLDDDLDKSSAPFLQIPAEIGHHRRKLRTHDDMKSKRG